ncbi:MAG: hypothetical protein KDD62_08100, partial [Bdellovibrionales bacterium]|nr:hypothetical protein [Bdellovibrionales bacterium]
RKAAAKSFETVLNTGIDAYALFLPDGEDPDSIAKTHQDSTAKYLQTQTSRPLFDCYLDYVVSETGVSSVRELGEATKTKVWESLKAVLLRVENAFERDLLVGKTARFLQVDKELLLSGFSEKSEGAPVPVKEVSSVPVSESIQAVARVDQLPVFDRLLLHVVMTKKHLVCQEILRDSHMCLVLHPSTLGFIEDVDQIFSDPELSEEEQKELVRLLLKDKGATWVAHWKMSYKMLADPAVDMDKAFVECKRAFRRLSLKAALDKARAMLKTCADEEKDVLGARIVKLSKELQEPA